MPKNKEEKVTCVNHPEKEMGKYEIKLLVPAIISQQGSDDANVDFDSGMIVSAYRCSECSYIELYNPDEPI